MVEARLEGHLAKVGAKVEARGEGRGARGVSKGEGRGLLPHPLSRARTEESHATLSLSTCTSTSGPCSRLNRCTDTVTARTWTSCVHVHAHVQVHAHMCMY